MSKKVPTIQPIKEKRVFNTPDEFNEYYNAHEDFFEKTTTCKLNKMFEVPGFKITKLQGVVSLKNIPESRVTANDRIEKLSTRVLNLEEMMNKCIKTVNETVAKTNTALEELHRLRDNLQTALAQQQIQLQEIAKQTQQQVQQQQVTHRREPENEREREPEQKPQKQEKPEAPPTYRRVPGKMNPIAAQWAGLIEMED